MIVPATAIILRKVEKTMKPMVRNGGVANQIQPRHIMVIRLNYLMSLGTAMSKDVALELAVVVGVDVEPGGEHVMGPSDQAHEDDCHHRRGHAEMTEDRLEREYAQYFARYPQILARLR